MGIECLKLSTEFGSNFFGRLSTNKYPEGTIIEKQIRDKINTLNFFKLIFLIKKKIKHNIKPTTIPKIDELDPVIKIFGNKKDKVRMLSFDLNRKKLIKVKSVTIFIYPLNFINSKTE